MKNNFGYSKTEIRLFKKLNTPRKIQDFLVKNIRHNPAKDGVECRSPRQVLKLRRAHCMEGALLAAAILEFHGERPLVMDLRATQNDLDHVVAVFKRHGCWGAVSKTNHMVLRYREPVYKSIRELVMSYFHEYFLDSGKKTLREYSRLFDLRHLNYLNWRTSEKDLEEISEFLDKIRHYKILNKKQIRDLRKADKIEIRAGKLIEYKLGRAKIQQGQSKIS